MTDTKVEVDNHIDFKEPEGELSLIYRIPVTQENIPNYIAETIDLDGLKESLRLERLEVEQIQDRNVKARKLLGLKLQQKKIDEIQHLKDENVIRWG